jgi:hypothetical protein
MPQTYEKPTVKNEDTLRNDSKKYTHPAYGIVGLSRGQCSPPMSLFGSSIKHSHFITLRIHTAEKDCNGDYSFIHARKPLVEVMLSGTQLGEMLSSMNVGDGVPCTIRMTENNWNIPAILDEETPISESRKSMNDRLNTVMEKTDRMIADVNALLKDKKSANKGELTALTNQLAMIRQDIFSNLPFVAKCFDEKIEKTVQYAKGEVDTFVAHTLRAAGMDAIASGNYRVEIPYNNTTLAIENKDID